MARQAQTIRQRVQRAPDDVQQFTRMRAQLGARKIKHRPILLVDDLNSQTLWRDIEQDLVAEGAQVRLGLDQRFDPAFDLEQGGTLANFAGLILVRTNKRYIAFDDLSTQVMASYLAHRSRQVFTATRQDQGAVADTVAPALRHQYRVTEKVRDALQITVGG